MGVVKYNAGVEDHRVLERWENMKPKLEPTLRNDAKGLIRDLIAAAGGCLKGSVRLYKTFYIAHLMYWRYGPGVLTAYPIVHMPEGPGIDQGPALLKELADEGKIRVDIEFDGPYPEYTYRLQTKPRSFDRSDPRDRSVIEAVQWAGAHSAAQLSEITHEHSRSWKLTKSGEELDIYLDVLTDEEYQNIKSTTAEMKQLVGEVFGER
ncbi:MAG TPA: hypothetical protein VFJ58_15620 [Armatimonadota bacterium]|nr:hypothetical protein [Armatimonadota bacterium]